MLAIIAGGYVIGGIIVGAFSYFMLGMSPLTVKEKLMAAGVWALLWPFLGTMFVLTGLYHRFKR